MTYLHITTCKHQPQHHPNCTCQVQQYPWHEINGFVLQKHGNTNITLSSLFICKTYDLCIKHLSKYKILGLDQIPNSILKNMPTRFHYMLFLLFIHYYKQQSIPPSQKTSNTILLYKKGHLYQLSNHCLIALANTIYELVTFILTTLLSFLGEKYQILHDSQEGFHQKRCTSRQIQILITALEDARFITQDIYLLFIDFTNAFGSINHAKLHAIMFDLGFP